MTQQVEQVPFECFIRVIGPELASHKMYWTIASQHDEVGRALAEELTHAITANVWPSLRRVMPAELRLKVNGTVGFDDLVELVELLAKGAEHPSRTENLRLGRRDVEILWTPLAHKTLDQVRPNVAQTRGARGGNRIVTEARKDASARLKELAERVMPRMAPEDVKELEGILRAAQIEPPPNRTEFVDTVNTLLDAFGLRVRGDDGQVGRLNLNSKDVLTLTRSSGGNRGFKNTSVEIVGVPRIRVGNRYTRPNKHQI